MIVGSFTYGNQNIKIQETKIENKSLESRKTWVSQIEVSLYISIGQFAPDSVLAEQFVRIVLKALCVGLRYKTIHIQCPNFKY